MMNSANLPGGHFQNRRHPRTGIGNVLIDPQGEIFEETQRGNKVSAGLVLAMIAWVPGLPLRPSAGPELPIS